MEYLDFELRVAPGSGSEYPVSVVRSPAGETTSTMRFPFDETALRYHIRGLENAVLKSASLRRDVSIAGPENLETEEFGKRLFQALFTPEVQLAFRRSQDQARGGNKGLRIRLRVEAPDLASLPWEFMYDPSDREFLCLSTDTPVVRYMEFDQPPPALTIQPPLSILVMIASPGDKDKLNHRLERERIETATSFLRNAGLVKLTVLEGSTWRHLQQALRPGKGTYHVFHFVGHGGFDAEGGEGMLGFTDDDGNMKPLGATEVGSFISDHPSMRLVVLNSCLGAKGNREDLFSSTSATLVGRGIPAVVGMQFEISDDAAIEFSRSLYEALAEGLPIDMAVAEARKAVRASRRHSVEWGTPVLHMRSPDGVLFRIDGMTPSQARASAQYPTPTAPVPAQPPAAPAPSPAAAPMPAAAVPAIAPAPAVIPTPPAPTPLDSASRNRALWIGAGAAGILLAGFGLWQLIKPPLNQSTGPGLAISAIALGIVPDTIDVGGEVPVDFQVTYGGLPLGDSAAAGALRQAEARAVLRSASTSILAVVDHDRPGAFKLKGLSDGTTQVWPVLLRRGGDSLVAPSRTVVVHDAGRDVLAASNEFQALSESLHSDSLADAVLLERLEAFNTSRASILRTWERDRLETLLKGMQGLVAARSAAGKVVDDVNVPLPARYDSLKAYLDLATRVREGHGPSIAADTRRLEELNAAPVGTVKSATASVVGTSATINVRYVRGSSGKVTIEWRRDGVVALTQPYTVPQRVEAGWPFDFNKNLSPPGRWEVRVLNGTGQLVFRHQFETP